MTSVLPPASPRPRGPGRAQFLLLATLFFTPFVAAWLLFFYFPGARPQGLTNYGQLVTPVRSLPKWTWAQPDGKQADAAETLQGKWMLVQLIGADCDQACVDRVVLSRQTRTALNADRERVQRVVLASAAADLAGLQKRFAAEHPDLLWRSTAEPDAARAFFQGPDAQTLYLVDPLGNYLMFYPGGRDTMDDFKGIKKDIGKLLKLSHIG